MGVSTPASPAGAPAPASTSPPQSDFGMDIGGGQISMPVSQIGGNAMMHGDVSRSSSFSADKAPSVVVDSIAGGGPRAGQTGLGGRGYPSGSVVDDALLERWEIRATTVNIKTFEPDSYRWSPRFFIPMYCMFLPHIILLHKSVFIKSRTVHYTPAVDCMTK